MKNFLFNPFPKHNWLNFWPEVYFDDISPLDMLNLINPRRACAARVTVVWSLCVCVCVCLSVTLHLTSRMSVRLKNDTIYLTGTEGQKIRAVFSKTASFERYGVICVSRQRARPYLVFVTTQASSLVKKANEILSTTRNTNVEACSYFL